MLALIAALTVAQPFGVIASKDEGAPPPPTDAESGESVHAAHVLGIPVLSFRLYYRTIFLSGVGENSANETLRVRSWFWLPALTNSTEVTETLYEDDVTVFREGDTRWATIDDPAGQMPDAWRLSAGIASPAGLVYWVLAAILIVATRRRRSTPGAA